MNYYQIRVECTQPEAEALAEFIEATDAVSVSLEDAQDEPLFEPKPDEMLLWSHVRITGLYTDIGAAERALSILQQQYPSLTCSSIEEVIERDWVSETQAQFQPQCFGERLWVYPAWETIPPNHAPVIKLSPGLAFGTGNHPTTQMCLAALVKCVEPGMQVIDFGCGSGILTLAALKLGASKVYAVDIDPQAVEATQNNAALNEVSDGHLWVGDSADLTVDSPIDLIVANILAQPLIDLNGVFKKLLRPKGRLILAGLLQEQAQAITAIYQPWVALQVDAMQAEWVCLVGTVG